MMEVLLHSVFVILLLSLTTCSANHYGVIYAEDANGSGNSGFYCMMYNPRFHPVPTLAKDAAKVPVVDLMPATFCDDPTSPGDVAGHALAIARGNCTFSEKARNVQDIHGQIALIISKEILSEPIANDTSDYLEINVTVALMGATSFQELKGLGKHVTVQLYAPVSPHVDYNLILIWVLAIGTVVLGAYWSGTVKNQQRLQRHRLSQRRSEAAPGEEVPEEQPEEQETFDVSPKFIAIFVVMMCVMLVSLYFLYDYLVYFIIALFTVASSTALYSVLKLVLIRIPCIGRCRFPRVWRIPFVTGQPEVRRVVLGLMCLGVGIWWAIERKADYSWILQDMLGTVFCIHMLKTVRLSSLKACTILLVLLFFYDIFFVFITPLLTKTGQSVMVDVATGEDSTTGEMLPMVLRVPRFDTSVLSVCSLPYSLLGFGDILVPGLLVSYCHGFDLKVQSGRVYFISCTIAYGIGLMLTFLALALMNSGQPALLYLVPCTLLTTFMIAAKRHEMQHIWHGELDQVRSKIPDAIPVPTSGPDTDLPHNAMGSDVANNAAAVPNGNAGPATLHVPNGITTGGRDLSMTDSSFQSDNEHQYLIQR